MKLPSMGDHVLVDAGTEHVVYGCEYRNGHVILTVVEVGTERAERLVFTADEIPYRIIVVPSFVNRVITERLSRQDFDLAVEALKLRSAHLIDPLFAVNVSQIDLLPHQADAVYRHILQRPRVRFLLADDPGLGKTIMAGLVLKELRARGAIRKCLVIAPAHLCEQWRRELSDWFQEEFQLLDRSSLPSASKSSFFDRNPAILASLDYAKQDAPRRQLCEVEWDLVIFDEAHKLSAKRIGKEVDKTRRYQLGEDLAPRAKHLLFLTATPHSGDDSSYYLLLNLLEPNLFAGAEQLKQASQRHGGLPFVLRRSKDHVTDLGGNRLFKRRTVKTLQLTMTPGERDVYDRVTEYVTFWYPNTSASVWLSGQRKRNVALALTVLQRRVGSGMRAIGLSLRRRQTKLQALQAKWAKYQRLDSEFVSLESDEDQSQLDDQQAVEWEQLLERLEGISAAETLEELTAEIQELETLINLVRRVEISGAETKLSELKRVVEQLLKPQPTEKLLIFSEFKDTVEFLRQRLEAWGLTVAMIHGGQNVDERRRQERRFRDEAQVMVATDAAAEGINLQFCHLMINYDLPWNPNRLEQRMGRIHRYGQMHDCFIWNLLYHDTREGDILARLLLKIERMKRRPELGDTIYDVISGVLSDVNLEKLIIDAIVRHSDDEAVRFVDVELEARVNDFLDLLREHALASQYIDLSVIRQFVRESRDAGVGPADIERFVRTAVESIGGGLIPDKDGGDGIFRLGIPKRLWPKYEDAGYSPALRVTFDREAAKRRNAEYLAPGHPILDRLLELTPTKRRPLMAVLAWSAESSGSFWLYRLKVKDATGAIAHERLEAFLYTDDDGCIESVPATIIRGFRDGPKPGDVPESSLASIQKARPEVEARALSRLDQLLSEIGERRAREGAIKRQWLDDSFGLLIRETDGRIHELSQRVRHGERNLQGLISIEEQRQQRLVRERQERLQTVDAEARLTMVEPELEAVCILVR